MTNASPALNLGGSIFQEKNCVNYCSENGICDMTDDVSKCYCLPGWMGTGCHEVRTPTAQQKIYSRWSDLSERAIKKCPDSIKSVCKAGDCIIINNNQLECVCDEDHVGKFCERESRKYLLHTIN